jgi:hypothetical protein
MKFFRLVAYFISISLGLFADESRATYLTGYTWYHFSDWKLTSQDYGRIPPQGFDPAQVGLGDTIFIDFSSVEQFVNHYLPKIQHQVILITSNYGFDADCPMPGRFGFLLEDDRIAAWFLQNLDRSCSEKLIPIPIGLANPCWEHGNLDLVERMVTLSLLKKERRDVLYINLTYRPEREDCFRSLKNNGFMFHSVRHFDHYLQDLSNSIFVASPRGNGLDTHRTWESLLMGCYPIVPSSTLNPLYEDLPVVVIDNWDAVNVETLQESHRKLSSKQWSRDKLYAPYWFAKVKAVQEKIRHKSSELL